MSQFPVSLFLNGALLGTHLVKGTADRKDIWEIRDVKMNAAVQYLRLYRGQDGITVHEIEIRREDSFAGFLTGDKIEKQKDCG